MKAYLSAKELFASHGAVASALLLALMICLSVAPGLVPLFMVASLLALVVTHVRSKGTRTWLPTSSTLFWCLPLYVWYLVGLIWSEDMDYAWFDLGIKAGMGVVPLVVWRIPGHRRTGGKDLMAWFVAGNVLAVVLCCMVALVRTVVERFDGGPAYGAANFIASRFSLFLHPSYFALQACFALVILVFGRAPALPQRMGTVFVVALLVGILLCGSKMGWAALVVVFIFLVVAQWRSPAARRKLLLAGAAMMGVFLLLVVSSPYVKEKVDQLVDVGAGQRPAPDATGSSEVRELVWNAGGQLLREQWLLGTGTGDVKNELLKRYAELGYTHPLKQRLNAHSQLLQTPLTLGVLGGLLLALLILVPLARTLLDRDMTAALFVLLLAVNWAVESMLEVQAGVVFLVFGALMLLLRNPGSDPSTQA